MERSLLFVENTGRCSAFEQKKGRLPRFSRKKGREFEWKGDTLTALAPQGICPSKTADRERRLKMILWNYVKFRAP